MRPPPPTIQPPKPREEMDADDRARERRGQFFALFFITCVLAFITLTTLLGWVAWATVFWGVAQLFGGA